MTESKICTCPSGDGSLRWPCPAHPAVEQAGGDEREEFEAWMHTFDLPPQLDGETFADERYLEAACFGQFVYDDPLTQRCWAAWQARAALAQPSPAQAEAERPELWAVHAQGPDELYAAFTREGAEKHAAELNALPMPEGIAVGAVVVPSPWPEVEHWKYLAEQERDHKNEIAVRLRQFERICEWLPQDAIDGGWTVQGIRCYAKRLEDQLKSAQARVAGLELGIARIAGDFLPDNSGQAELALDEMRQALHELLAAAPTQAQHSVPDGAADLCRFLAKLYCELDGLRYSTAKLPAEQIADALIFKWPVLQGARNQLNIKRISEQPYDESKLHSAIAAMLAAAPGQEVGHE